jgi:hypothetical protein
VVSKFLSPRLHTLAIVLLACVVGGELHAADDEFLAEGLTNREIASRLFLALNTVKAHSSNIYGKLGVHSRTQMVARARALGLLPST